MLEIVGHDLLVGTRRCAMLAAQAGALFPGISRGNVDISPWAGARPATPTGLPIVGRSPLTNLSLNAGHGALGWTLACGSAELLAALIEGRPSPIGDQAAFQFV
jgi:D-amino-acid dehydrogenase